MSYAKDAAVLIAERLGLAARAQENLEEDLAEGFPQAERAYMLPQAATEWCRANPARRKCPTADELRPIVDRLFAARRPPGQGAPPLRAPMVCALYCGDWARPECVHLPSGGAPPAARRGRRLAWWGSESEMERLRLRFCADADEIAEVVASGLPRLADLEALKRWGPASLVTARLKEATR